MTGRAAPVKFWDIHNELIILKIRVDKTSSFPSRAVVCSVVYAFAITTASDMDGILVAFFIILAGFLASFARVTAILNDLVNFN